MFTDLNNVSGRSDKQSVHLTDFPEADENLIDKALEERMEMAQKISSMVLSLRKKNNIRVRQPLNKIIIPVLNDHVREVVMAVEDLILSEVNVKELEYITDDSGILVKRIKPNFKTLGPKHGKMMKQIAGAISHFSQDDIRKLEAEETYTLNIGGVEIVIGLEDAEISTQDIPGWSVANQDHLTVALDMTITPELQEEGLARELVNRIQNLRKDKGFEVTDHIVLCIEKDLKTQEAFVNFKDYICSETLAKMKFEDSLNNGESEIYELIEGTEVKMSIWKD
jgi:isoleucyl-tRNA synthetase